MTASTSTSTSIPNTGVLSSLIASPHFLRRVLWVDAATGLATGVLQLLLPGFLAGLLGLPEALLVEAGWAMLAFAAGITFLATRQVVPLTGVGILIAANLLWVVGCIAVLFGGLVTPTITGMAFITVQAVTVAVLAELEWIGLRKASAARW
ncbi:MAG TPA: hypothetical protein VE934_03720 [Polaromonas sp.]|uniref:hypothetical protein n=1 Tax=Polaromonas sp. TaxID=1869339 RepID=UPI002D4BC26E|nr:hypothetical protein [Polaromonas sp.]HYW56040.1 hypothetical protein [Polaromonas sp.]